MEKGNVRGMWVELWKHLLQDTEVQGMFRTHEYRDKEHRHKANDQITSLAVWGEARACWERGNSTEEEAVLGPPSQLVLHPCAPAGCCDGMSLRGKKGGLKGSHNVEASLC